MERTLVKNVKNKINKKVKIMGWVHKIRKLSKITFLILRDRSGIMQCVVDPSVINVNGLKVESVVEIIGEVSEGNNSTGNVEIQVNELTTISSVEEDIPIEVNTKNVQENIDTILTNRVLSLRHLKSNSIFKIQAVLVQGFIEFLKSEGFTQVFTPKIVSEGAEGGTAIFEIKYFEKKAYLAQSPQFYKQMLVGAGFERVFEVGHVYRAEEHNTLRHLNEYVSLDLEMGFINDEIEIMELETNLLKSIFYKVNQECKRELEILDVEIPEIKEKIPALRLTEAINILKNQYEKDNLIGDLDTEGERLIAKYVKEKYNSDFVFLTHYPRSKRPMYTMPAEENLTHSFDLLYKGLEITTGGQRINDYNMLINSMIFKGLNSENFEGYLQSFKYGMPPHGGLAIGLERLTAQLLGYKNVRETSLFPRDRDRILP